MVHFKSLFWETVIVGLLLQGYISVSGQDDLTPLEEAQMTSEAMSVAIEEERINQIEEAKLSRTMTGNNNPFRKVQRLLRAHPMAKKMSRPAFVLERVGKHVMRKLQRLGIKGANVKSLLRTIVGWRSPMSRNRYDRMSPDERLPDPAPDVCPWPEYNCGSRQVYRTFDGSCNNLDNPLFGRSFIPFRRVLSPDYADGVSTLRRSRRGAPLPSAREVSFTVHPDEDHPNQLNTLAVMQWGQFIDHDLDLTPTTQMASGSGDPVNVECGRDGCELAHEACAPIRVVRGEPAFRGRRCLEFVRTQTVPNLNCTMGPRQQINQINSYIDASMVYGSSKETADNLRVISQKRGQLRLSPHPLNTDSRKYKGVLPSTDGDNTCNALDSQGTCYAAGDVRVNEQSLLTVVHTLWVREHNRIEDQLQQVNPFWSGEKLYQETRRIVGAMMQHITYNEFLPLVLGAEWMRKHGLDLLERGRYSGYDSKVDASISNAFSTAAFRFGHTLLPGVVRRIGENNKQKIPVLHLSQTLFRPSTIINDDEGGIDAFTRALIGQQIQGGDRFVVDDVTEQLFSANPPNDLGTDLISLNIQRGRDHGLPGYMAWREWCGLSTTAKFEAMEDMSRGSRVRLASVYRAVADIDLFSGGIAETHVHGGLVGPTFACIIGEQYSRLRRGDAYWYENGGSNVFTDGQLAELRKVTLARVLCENSDNIIEIQPRAMEFPFREAFPSLKRDGFQALVLKGVGPEEFKSLWNADYNARTKCQYLPEIGFRPWKDYSKA